MPRSSDALLLGRAWNGNVRELRNYLERRVSLEARDVTREPPRADVVPVGTPHTRGPVSELRLDLPFKEAQALLLQRFELAYLSALLVRADGNVTRAAQLGGISRRFLQRRMAELGLRQADEGAADDDDG